MKKTLILFFITTNILYSQDSTHLKPERTKEFYFTLTDFSPLSLGLSYKNQIGRNTFFKIGLVNLSFNHQKRVANDPIQDVLSNTLYSGGVLFGFEFRKSLGKRFTLFHGPNISYSYSHLISRKDNSIILGINERNTAEAHTASIPYSIGFLFEITKHFLISTEVNPSINYTNTLYKYDPNSSMNYNIDGFNFSLSNRFFSVSFVYRL